MGGKTKQPRYLNEFHRQWCERSEKTLARTTPPTLEAALENAAEVTRNSRRDASQCGSVTRAFKE